LVALLLLEGFLRLADPIGLNYDREFTTYRTQALQFTWDGVPPEELAKVDLDGRLYEHKPNLDLDCGSFRLRTNSLGCRGPEVAREKPADVFRIVVLGDSVAFGWGVDDAVTFVRRLEAEWVPGASGKRLEVVNTALPMYDTNQELAALREVGLSLHPDLVLLVYVVNDVEPTRDVVETLLTGKQPPDGMSMALPDDVWSWLGDKVGTVLPATGKLLGSQTNLDARIARTLPPGETYSAERFGRGPRGWPRSQAALRQIRDACREASVPLLLLDHTAPPLLPLPAFCEAEGIACAPLRFTPADHALGITNSRLDPHANARGHDLLLQRLRKVLDERGLLPR
jgi:lysophospholipase L1-like esterase